MLLLGSSDGMSRWEDSSSGDTDKRPGSLDSLWTS